MIRRPRVKVALNLSAGRRSTNKSSDEPNKNNKSDEIKSADLISAVSSDANVSKERESSSHLAVEADNAITPPDNASNLNENVADSCPSAGLDNRISSSEVSTTSQSDDNTFKTPMKLTKNDSDTSTQSSITNKFRKFKFAPRLDSFRNVGKSPQEKDDAQRGNDTQSQKEENAMIASQSSTTPVTPASPSEMHARRPQTPHEVMQPHFSQQHPKEQSNVIVNHNIAYPTLSQSPFPYHGHGRIRTESVTSLKSSREYTVANLHPRKSFREDQKMLDIKRESRERLSKKDIDKSKLRMFDMIYFNPQNNPMKPRPAVKIEKVKLDLKREPSPTPPPEKSSAVLVPRLKLNASGEMVLDETSLVVENEQQRQNRILIANNTVVYDDELSGSYGIYKRQQRTKEWLHDETVKFYRCLNTVGTDFSMMLNLFPNRTRRDLKLKFKKEEKNNPHLVDKALLKHNVFDLDELQRDLDQEEAEKKKKREENSKSAVKEHLKKKILKNQEAKLKAEERSRSKIEKILSDGDLALKIAEENQLKENLDVKKKRKYTRKSKEEVPTTPSDGLQMLAGFPGLSDKPPSDKRRAKKKKSDVDSDEQPAAKTAKLNDFENAIQSPARPAMPPVEPEPEMNQEITTPALPPTIVDFTDIPIEIHTDDHDSTSLQQCCETSESTEKPSEDVDSMICFDDVQSEPNETFEKSPTKNHTLLVARNEWENVADEPIGISYSLFAPDEPAEMIVSDEIEPASLAVPEQCKVDAEMPPSTSAAAPAKSKNKSKKKKFKPTLITRMKLDANGEMVPEDAQEEPPKVEVAEVIPPEIVEPEQPVAADADAVPENLNIAEQQSQPEFQELPQPSTSSKVQEEKSDPPDEFDDEAFLRSLDLDNLAIVEAHKEDKVCYEIYKSDPVTQEILGEPLNLPQKYIDLIVKLMTQPDEDESLG